MLIPVLSIVTMLLALLVLQWWIYERTLFYVIIYSQEPIYVLLLD